MNEFGEIKLIYRYTDQLEVKMRLNPDLSLDEVVAHLEGFLHAAGYGFTGRLEIIDEVTKGS